MLVAGVIFGGCGGKEDTCANDANEVARCNRVYEMDPCETAADRCATACYAQVKCPEFERLDRGLELPPWLRLCLAKCRDPFTCSDDRREIDARWRCDGEKDCVNGSDERDCMYFECESGELVRAEGRCDEWAHCEDRSDELRCDYFLCADNSMTVPPSAVCDDNAQCPDGSDEESCP